MLFPSQDLADFQCTMTYYQFLLDSDFVIIHLSMIRVYIYLFYYDFKKNFRKFQWLNFLKISNEQILIEEHFFLKTEAKRYFFLIKLAIKAIKVNKFMYFIGSGCVLVRVFILAYHEIPFKWFLFSTLTNAISYVFLMSYAFQIYNYFVLIYFASSMFIYKSLKSISNQYSIYSLKKLEKSKLDQFTRINLIQFNKLITIFKYGQMNFNYTFSLCSGVITICYNYPYILLFTDLDLTSFIITFGLYLQGLIISLWLLIKINCNLTEEVSFERLVLN